MKTPIALALLTTCLVSAAAIASAEQPCGGTYRGFQYAITSPNYPREYPGRQDCVYRLQGDAASACEQEFHLQFQDFGVRPSENCEGDHLRVGDRSVFCGTVAGLRRFTGKNNTLTLVFHSGERSAAKGFKILVTAFPCSAKQDPPRSHANSLDHGSNENDDLRTSTTRFTYPSGDDKAISSEIQSLQSAAAEKPVRVTSYLFLPPGERETSAKSDASHASVTLTDDLLPPSPRPAADFLSKSAPTALDKSSSTFAAQGPAPSRIGYGSESALGPVDYDCDKGNPAVPQHQPQPGDADFPQKFAYNPRPEFQGDASRLGSSSNLLYDPHRGLLNLNGYQTGGYQGSNAYPYGGYQGANAYSYSGYQGANAYPYSGYQGGYAYPNFPSGNSYNYQSGFYPSGYGYGSGIGAYPYGNSWGGLGASGFQNGECCRLQSGRRFQLASPGFPGTGASPGSYACRYSVAKSSPDVCRLRLSFRFFNLGADGAAAYCSYGHLEIDGRRYCGCRSGLTLQVPFPESLAKPIFLSYAGYPRGKFAGFLIDVVQESCGSPGYPGYPGGYQQPYDPHSPIYSPYLQRRQGQSANSSSAELRSRRDLGYSYGRPSIPFAEGDFGGNNNLPRDRLFGGSCQSRLFLDWLVASKEAVLRNSRCERFGVYRSASARSDDSAPRCEDVGDARGVVRSSPEATGLQCYRIHGAPGFCKLELAFRKFQLEESEGCAKSYLSFSEDGEKYCGASLNNHVSVFDLARSNSVEIHFAFDARGNGNSFEIAFSQQPCEVPTQS